MHTFKEMALCALPQHAARHPSLPPENPRQSSEFLHRSEVCTGEECKLPHRDIGGIVFTTHSAFWARHSMVEGRRR